MADIGALEFLALAVIAMIVIGPEKLPRYMAEAARFLRKMRQMANSAKAEVRRELGPDFDDIKLSDLNPRSAVRKHLLEPIDLGDLEADGRSAGRNGRSTGDTGRGGNGRPPSSRPSAAADPPAYDPDAT